MLKRIFLEILFITIFSIHYYPSNASFFEENKEEYSQNTDLKISLMEKKVLPREIWVEVFKHLDPIDINSSRAVSKNWAAQIGDLILTSSFLEECEKKIENGQVINHQDIIARSWRTVKGEFLLTNKLIICKERVPSIDDLQFSKNQNELLTRLEFLKHLDRIDLLAPDSFHKLRNFNFISVSDYFEEYIKENFSRKKISKGLEQHGLQLRENISIFILTNPLLVSDEIKRIAGHLDYEGVLANKLFNQVKNNTFANALPIYKTISYFTKNGQIIYKIAEIFFQNKLIKEAEVFYANSISLIDTSNHLLDMGNNLERRGYTDLAGAAYHKILALIREHKKYDSDKQFIYKLKGLNNHAIKQDILETCMQASNNSKLILESIEEYGLKTDSLLYKKAFEQFVKSLNQEPYRENYHFENTNNNHYNVDSDDDEDEVFYETKSQYFLNLAEQCEDLGLKEFSKAAGGKAVSIIHYFNEAIELARRVENRNLSYLYGTLLEQAVKVTDDWDQLITVIKEAYSKKLPDISFRTAQKLQKEMLGESNHSAFVYGIEWHKLDLWLYRPLPENENLYTNYIKYAPKIAIKQTSIIKVFETTELTILAQETLEKLDRQIFEGFRFFCKTAPVINAFYYCPFAYLTIKPNIKIERAKKAIDALDAPDNINILINYFSYKKSRNSKDIYQIFLKYIYKTQK